MKVSCCCHLGEWIFTKTVDRFASNPLVPTIMTVAAAGKESVIRRNYHIRAIIGVNHVESPIKI